MLSSILIVLKSKLSPFSTYMRAPDGISSLILLSLISDLWISCPSFSFFYLSVESSMPLWRSMKLICLCLFCPSKRGSEVSKLDTKGLAAMELRKDYCLLVAPDGLLSSVGWWDFVLKPLLKLNLVLLSIDTGETELPNFIKLFGNERS